MANIDVAPTIVAAAHTRAGLRMDGRSLWPLFADPGIFWGRDLLHEGPVTEGAETKFTALRTPRWLYVRYLTGGEELYDLLVDPNQLTNLRTDPAAAPVRLDLRGRLTGFQSCIGADCRRGPELALAVEVAGECPSATVKIGLAAVDPVRRSGAVAAPRRDRRAGRRTLGGRQAARARGRGRARPRHLQGRPGDDAGRGAARLPALVELQLLAPGEHVVQEGEVVVGPVC